ncbi:hypothetical protein D9619_003206 [Psilocybe cf. subviscida]|uniref:DUF7053 domain-containing protein n=1 Tax=Psilocybe cf. subviscida TaxID=2480587 RepID=A0A8H5AVQ0_9AGAR|nr:hypothetical protein D9619_003206 [Psilocybe cf. subviscida]
MKTNYVLAAMVHFSLRLWPLYLTREFTVQRQIPAAASDVLHRVVQDPDVALNISPLVTSVIPDPPSQTQARLDMSWYTVTERIKQGSERTVRLRVLWARVSDGADATVFAALGTRVRSSVRVREVKVEEGEDPQALYEETMIVEGLCFLMPLIISSAQKIHTDMLDIVAARVTS